MRLLVLSSIALVSLVAGCNQKEARPTEEAKLASDVEYISDPNVIAGPNSRRAETADEESAVETLTSAQGNAVRSAKQYLDMTGFSREGLIDQLSSDAGDGYSVADATVAVDSLIVNWEENAAKTATQYLNMSGFSCNGLIEQLSSSAGDKYTVKEATFGARQAGAC